MYNLIKHSDVYSKSSGSLWQYYQDEPAIGVDGNIDFTANNNNGNSFQFKQKITGLQEAVVQKMLK